MSKWKVEIQGETFDLDALKYALAGTGDTIVEKEGRHYLLSDDFIAHSDARIVRSNAERILMRTSALLDLQRIMLNPITVGTVFRKRGKGHDVYVFPVKCMVLVLSGGRNASKSEPLVALYESNNNVRRAIDFFHNHDSSYRSIYLTYEIIRDELGGGSKGADEIAVLASVDPRELKIFYENAHHESLSGDAARHAGKSGSKKSPTVSTRMPIEVARELIRRILNAWIERKLRNL